MKKLIGGVAGLVLLLAGCGTSGEDGPLPANGASARVVADLTDDGSTSTPASAAVTGDVSAACTSFRTALASTKGGGKNGPEDGKFIAELEKQRGGAEPNAFSTFAYFEKYSRPYLPADTPDAIKVSIEAFAATGTKMVDLGFDEYFDAPESLSAAALDAYTDAFEQCDAAGVSLADA